jgi:hypothetical protein
MPPAILFLACALFAQIAGATRSVGAVEILDNGVRLGMDVPAGPDFDSARPTLLIIYATPNGSTVELIHPNPENKILHTALVGEMNGLLQAMTLGTPEEQKWGTFGGPRAYSKWIPTIDASAIPPRPADAVSGTALMQRVAALPRDRREEQIAGEILRGNVPEFLRQFTTVHIAAMLTDGKPHTIELRVMPDYLSVGSDADFVRVPLTPMTAKKIADAFECVLPTRKIVDEVYRQANVKLEPRPMTERREAVDTFLEHNRIIEEQRKAHALGELVAGIKKDVVLTNRLADKPGHVAIYGWHQPDGQPIQPLTTVHIATYVDYSHGIRLVDRQVIVDGKATTIEHVLKTPDLCELLSDEGPINISGMYSQPTSAPAAR